jgi:2-C-methyl-D-erythritol 4-phosphate cytidylyltransferase
MINQKKYAVIVAGGKGTRMGGTIPKQFLPLLGLPVLCHSIMAFAHSLREVKIILVAPPDQIDSARTILKSYTGQLNITIVGGGETRFHSVQNGLKEVDGDGIVFIHDAVRPLVSNELIARCLEGAILHGSAIPAIPAIDSMRLINPDGSSQPIDRNNLRIIQTPQTFRSDVILPAFKQDYDPAFTDEATVVEKYGAVVFLVEGDKNNIKITTPGDMIIADTLLKTSD